MIKQIDDELYQTVCSWWLSYGWPAMDRDLLPNTAYVSFVGEKPIVAGFLYRDVTARYGIFDWIVCNQEATKEERNEAFPELIKHVQTMADALNLRVVFTLSNNENLIRRLCNENFEIADQSVTMMMYRKGEQDAGVQCDHVSQ